MTRPSWDRFFIDASKGIAQRSKDPSMKVGAVIVRPNKTIAGLGYNGFPRGVRDDAERYANRSMKYAMAVHAELNAILNSREVLAGCAIYTTFHPCARCAAAIVNTDIAKVVCEEIDLEEIPERWREDVAIAKIIFAERGVIVARPED